MSIIWIVIVRNIFYQAEIHRKYDALTPGIKLEARLNVFACRIREKEFAARKSNLPSVQNPCYKSSLCRNGSACLDKVFPGSRKRVRRKVDPAGFEFAEGDP